LTPPLTSRLTRKHSWTPLHLDLQEAIEQLPGEHRTVASLRLLSGLTCRQIAAQLG